LARWLLPNTFEPRLGYQFQFLRSAPGRGRETIECEVVDLQPPFRLAYTWRDPADRAPSVVTWTLEPVPGGTRLRLSHTRADDGAAVAEAGARDNAAHAWDHQLAALQRLLHSDGGVWPFRSLMRPANDTVEPHRLGSRDGK
jgi:uncharacterized protein YndB with AHSA1/START domain